MSISAWLALMIGNSRLHWAWFEGDRLCQTWDTPHLPPETTVSLLQALAQTGLTANLAMMSGNPDFPANLTISAQSPLWLASVVPMQTTIWQTYPQTQSITLAQMPLAGLYPTLGIDRALALLGAATGYGLPSLVIDAGTALTFTGVGVQNQLIGGAILPGLRLQLHTLSEQTAVLPDTTQHSPVLPSPVLPNRWSTNTPEAIWSGVLYTLLAGLHDFIADWQQQFPASAILLTGGDADLLAALLQQQIPDLAAQIRVDHNLIFRGIHKIRTDDLTYSSLADKQ
jgi:type III pantothenate kinase